MLMAIFSAIDLRFLIFPALLLVYYLMCWARVGRDPKVEDVAPQYEPPAGISPGVARYIATGGSDGTTLAAVLSQLAADGVLSIQPQAGSYRIELLREDASVVPEAAALIEALFSTRMKSQPYTATAASAAGGPQVPSELREAMERIPAQQLASRGLAAAAELAVEPRRTVVLDPKSAVQVKLALDAIQDTFRRNLDGVYFRWNFVYVFFGMLATFVLGLGASLFIGDSGAPSTFVTLWLLLFTSIAGTVMASSHSAKPTKPTVGQRLSAILLPLLFFVLPGFLIAGVVLRAAQGFVISLLLAVALNSTFMVLMRAPTAAGHKAVEQLTGFREFLVRVEQDRLERVNTPEEKARLMNRFLPYAIAMGVKEAWGDSMAAAFSNAIVER